MNKGDFGRIAGKSHKGWDKDRRAKFFAIAKYTALFISLWIFAVFWAAGTFNPVQSFRNYMYEKENRIKVYDKGNIELKAHWAGFAIPYDQTLSFKPIFKDRPYEIRFNNHIVLTSDEWDRLKSIAEKSNLDPETRSKIEKIRRGVTKVEWRRHNGIPNKINFKLTEFVEPEIAGSP